MRAHRRYGARLIAALLAVAAFSSRAQDTDPFALHEIGPGVWAAIDGPDHRSGSNAGFIVGDDAVAVVDAFFDPAATRALVARIHALTTKPIRYVINTHYHLDHTGGDRVLREAGATIIAQRNARAWLHTENLHLLGERITPAQRALIATLPDPDLTTDRGLTLWLGARRIEVTYYPGHTGGDLTVSVPDARAMFCGDLLWRRVSPNLIDATVSLWVATESAFRRLPDAAAMRFVPGHGEVATLQDVLDFQSYLSDLSVFTKEARAQGLSGSALVAQVQPRMAAKWSGWAGFDRSLPREVGYVDSELAGTKRVPQPVDP